MLNLINDLDAIYKIMEESFPEDERRPYDEQRALLLDSRYSIYEEDGGFIATWEFDEFVFVEHFAVDKNKRNSGLGGKMLKEFLELSHKPICLEVEMPDTEIAKRRISFYERNGFFLNEYDYFQPPISKGKKIVPLMIMTSGEKVTKEVFEKIRNTLYKEIYKYESENSLML